VIKDIKNHLVESRLIRDARILCNHEGEGYFSPINITEMIKLFSENKTILQRNPF